MPGIITPPMRHMQEAVSYLNTKVSSMTRMDLLLWSNRIRNAALFMFIDLSIQNINRYLTFDAINSRGLPLSEFDKIKNYCILIDEIRGLSNNPDTKWFLAISELENFNVGSRSDEDTFITDLYNSFYNESVKKSEVHELFASKYNQLLTSSDSSLESELRDFIYFWPSYAKSFGFIFTKTRLQYYGTECSLYSGTWLTRIDNMELSAVTRVIRTACHLRLIPSEFESVSELCEKYSFRVHAVLEKRTNKNSGEIIGLAHDVLCNHFTLVQVHSRFCRWISNLAPLNQVIRRLCNNDPKYNYARKISGWKHCYYFLYEYEIGNSPAGVQHISWANTKTLKINTQEHILPQSHRDAGWWQAQWPDRAEADDYLHRLGNLVLTPNNSSLGNRSFPDKLTNSLHAHYYNHPNASNTEKRITTFTNGTDWLAKNILVRELDMMRFASRRWSVNCCVDNIEFQLPSKFVDDDGTTISITYSAENCIAEEEFIELVEEVTDEDEVNNYLDEDMEEEDSQEDE
jgi:hypothetical protein